MRKLDLFEGGLWETLLLFLLIRVEDRQIPHSVGVIRVRTLHPNKMSMLGKGLAWRFLLIWFSLLFNIYSCRFKKVHLCLNISEIHKSS